MAQLQLTGRNEFPSDDPNRRGKVDVSYVYLNLENMTTITFTIPLEEDTEEKVLEILKERLERAAKAGPSTVEIEL